MIKGVNRQVLEIKDTGCEYFTQALFFVVPEIQHITRKDPARKSRGVPQGPAGSARKQKAKSAQNNP